MEVVEDVLVAVAGFWEHLVGQVCKKAAQVQEIGQGRVAWFVLHKDIDKAQAGLGEDVVEDLLDRLSKKFDIDVDLSNELKPFPLAFEEMIHHRLGRNSFEFKLKNLKTNISKLLLEAGSDFDFNFHKEIMSSGIKEIITSNYDYNLELFVILSLSETRPSRLEHDYYRMVNNLEH